MQFIIFKAIQKTCNCRKLIKALEKYAEDKTIPYYLSKKTLLIFSDIKKVIDVEWQEYEAAQKKESISEIRSRAGKKGMKHRWG